MLIKCSTFLYLNAFEILPDLKNGGTCYDNGGTEEFSCTCVGTFVGNECQTDLCDGFDCQNGGTCVIGVRDGIRGPTCDCSSNFGGETCQFQVCGSDVFCYNGVCGGNDNEICQCRKENGKAKYHGESCDMPAACDGHPCQNGGICTGNTQSNNTQASFVIKYHLNTLVMSLLCRRFSFSDRIRNH